MTEAQQLPNDDFDAQVKSLLGQLDEIITKPKLPTEYNKHANKQLSGQRCRAILRSGFTGITTRCDCLLEKGQLCSGGHKDYIKYDEQGQEIYREWSW